MEGWWDVPALDQYDRSRAADPARATRCARTGCSSRTPCKRARPQPADDRAARSATASTTTTSATISTRRCSSSRMLYTCAYWADATHARRGAGRQARPRVPQGRPAPGMRVLDLGCGWGGFAAFAAEHYGAERHRLHRVAASRCSGRKEHYAHLPIDIRLDDYRNATGTYDAVVSIGLMEHVGPKNYRGYMELVDRCLAPDGVAFVHTIGGNRARAAHRSVVRQVHLPERGAAVARALDRRDGGHVRPRGRPQHRRGLRPDADGVVGATSTRVARSCAPLRRAVLPDVEVLPARPAPARSARASQQLFQIVMTRPGTPAPAGRRG